MSHTPIAYTYEADTHCPACTEARFGRGREGFIAYDDIAGPSEDYEGNPVGVIAPWDEWCEPSEPGVHYLSCGTCQGVIESHNSGHLVLRAAVRHRAPSGVCSRVPDKDTRGIWGEEDQNPYGAILDRAISEVTRREIGDAMERLNEDDPRIAHESPEIGGY